jgi:hypothetical protein
MTTDKRLDDLTSSDATTHKDLLDLSGYYAYELIRNPKKFAYDEVILTVNDHKFRVDRTIVGDATGLDALVVSNVATGENILIFVGTSDNGDWFDDFTLITERTPDQFIAARELFENLQADGVKLDFVCGNSLGGGLANYAAAGVQGVEVVTLSPAPVPAEWSGNGENVTNYIINNDPLYRSLKGAGLDGRIPGKQQLLPPGSYSANGLVYNHQGLYDMDAERNLNYSSNDYFPFSIWQPNILLTDRESYTKGIQIDATVFQQLTATLKNRLATMQTSLLKELDPLYEYIQLEHGNLSLRQETLHTALQEQFKPLNDEVQMIITVLDNIQLLARLWPQFCEDIVNFGTEKLKNLILDVQAEMQEAVIKLFIDAQTGYDDGFAQKLLQHSEQIEQNLHETCASWDNVTKCAEYILDQIKISDENIAQAIATNDNISLNLLAPPDLTTINEVKGAKIFSGLSSVMASKQEMLDINYEKFVQTIEKVFEKIKKFVMPIIHLGIGVLASIKFKISTHTLLLEKQLQIYQFIGNAQQIATLQQEYAETNINMQKFSEYEIALDIAKNTFTTYQNCIPNILYELKAYIQQAIFSEKTFGHIQQQAMLSHWIIEQAQYVFGEIWQSLQQFEASGIVVLVKQAEQTQSALKILMQDLEVIYFK